LEPTQEPIKKTFSVWYVIILVFLLALCGIGGWYYLASNQKIEKQENVVATAERLQFDLESGDTLAAIEKGEAALEDITNSETDIPALVYLARAYLQDGNESYNEEISAEKAFVVIEKILEIEPELAEAHRLKGYAYEITNNFDAAVASYKQALEFDSNYALVYAHIGHVASLLGEKEEAYNYYDLALSLDSGIELAQFGIAYILYEEKEYDDVQDILNTIKNNSDKAITISEVEMLEGLMALEKGSYTEAVEKLEAATETNSQNAQAWAALSTAHIATIVTSNNPDLELSNKRTRIEQIIQLALDIHPQNTYAMGNRGNVYALKGDCEFAIDYYEQARNGVPDDITLGVVEKNNAIIYLNNAITNCSL